MKTKRFIPRNLLKDVVAHLESPEITLITGARQVGKTVLLQMLKDHLIENEKILPENIFYFNLDIVKDWEFFQEQNQLIEFLKTRSRKNKIYLFVDEAQRVPDCARFFKGVYDAQLPVKLILTGSSSLELKAGLKESLTGRKKTFSLFPFSFLEFLSAKNKPLSEMLRSGTKISPLDRKTLISFFQEYTIWGGYPRVLLAESEKEKIDILAEIYTSYIEKDIVGFLEIKNRIAFSKLVRLLSGQIGQLVNINELSTVLKLDRATVERYLLALQETFVIRPVLPYYKNPRQEIIKQNKIYFSDTGLRNYSHEEFRPLTEREDAGLLFENSIFNELQLFLGIFQKVRFWRTKQGAEVDFLILEKDNFLPLEIKLHLKTPAVSLSLRNFIKKYKPKKALVINLDLFDKEIKIDKTRIYFLHPYEIEKMIKNF